MLPLGSIQGVKIGVQWTLIVAVAASMWAVGLVDGALLSLGLTASVLSHELAHAVVAVRRGVKVAGIQLGVFGGQTALHASSASARHEFAIAVAGPLASLAITLVTTSIAYASASFAVAVLAATNAVLFVSNAVPILPLDGGRACRALLARRLDRIDATRHVAFMNAMVGLVLALAGVFVIVFMQPLLGAPLVAMGVFVWLLGVLEVRRVTNEAARAEALHVLGYDPMDAPWARR